MAVSTSPRYVWEPAHRYFRWSVGRGLDLTIEGREHVPTTGPVLLAARHFHHYWDGAIFSATFEQPIHIVVGLDWSRGIGRRLMERLCRAARFPIILRTDDPAAASGHAGQVTPTDARRYLRTAVDETGALLQSGALVIVFPEGYPTIDPHGSRKPDRDAFLPFRPGFVQLVEHAQRAGLPPVPIVPVGMEYKALDPKERRWRVVMRFGEPVFANDRSERDALVAEIEARVRALSGYPRS